MSYAEIYLLYAESVAFLPFTVEKSEYRIVSGYMLDDGGHDWEKRFAQSERYALGNTLFLDSKVPGWQDGHRTSKSH